MSIYEDLISYATYDDAQVLDIKVKKAGQAMSVYVTFTNTGDLDWTFGVGFSFKDGGLNSKGEVIGSKTWDCWSGSRVLAGNAGSVDKHLCPKGASVTHTISNIPIDADVGLGTIQFKVGIWKQPTVPLIPPTLATWPVGDVWATQDSNGNEVHIVSLEPAATIGSVVLQ